MELSHRWLAFGKKLDMIVCLAMAIYTEQFSNQIWHTGHLILNIGVDILIMGIMWNLAFNLFYHHIFRIK
jgi:hypothetical protein